MPFTWTDDKYSTGVKEIDEQHKRLFKIINELEETLEKPELDNMNTKKIKRLIVFLGSYTKAHFGYEEECMFRNKCPLYKKNEDAHRKFINFYKDIRTESEEKGISKELAKKLYETSGNWLVNHIGKIDTHLRDCM